MRDSIRAALEVAEAHDVALGIEPEQANVVDSAAAARKLLDELRSPHLRVVIDAANLRPGPDTLHEAFELLGADLVLAHAKDVRPDGTFAAPGHGAVDFDLYLALLAPTDVPVIMHGLAEDEVPGSIAFLHAALGRA
jgi:sugar phosphate isomerase/epimerase